MSAAATAPIEIRCERCDAPFDYAPRKRFCSHRCQGAQWHERVGGRAGAKRVARWDGYANVSQAGLQPRSDRRHCDLCGDIQGRYLKRFCTVCGARVCPDCTSDTEERSISNAHSTLIAVANVLCVVCEGGRQHDSEICHSGKWWDVREGSSYKAPDPKVARVIRNRPAPRLKETPPPQIEYQPRLPLPPPTRTLSTFLLHAEINRIGPVLWAAMHRDDRVRNLEAAIERYRWQTQARGNHEK